MQTAEAADAGAGAASGAERRAYLQPPAAPAGHDLLRAADGAAERIGGEKNNLAVAIAVQVGAEPSDVVGGVEAVGVAEEALGAGGLGL